MKQYGFVEGLLFALIGLSLLGSACWYVRTPMYRAEVDLVWRPQMQRHFSPEKIELHDNSMAESRSAANRYLAIDFVGFALYVIGALFIMSRAIWGPLFVALGAGVKSWNEFEDPIFFYYGIVVLVLSVYLLITWKKRPAFT